MTKLLPAKFVTRETAALYRGAPLVIELRPRTLTLREKGRRQGAYTLKYEDIYELALKLQWREEQQRRARARKEER